MCGWKPLIHTDEFLKYNHTKAIHSMEVILKKKLRHKYRIRWMINSYVYPRV